jgi:ABC-type bacteriocin/lantibiotic exporter with double-glycine peptidase domain
MPDQSNLRLAAIVDVFRSAVAWYDPRLARSSLADSLVSEDSSDDAFIRELARVHGVRVRHVRLRQEGWQRSAVAPILAFTKSDRRPIALIPSADSRYEIPDPDDIDPDAFQLYPRLPSGVLSFRGLIEAGFARREKEVSALLLPIAQSMLANGTLPLVVYMAVRHSGMQWALAGILVVLSALAEAACSIGALRLQGKLKVILVPGIWERLVRTGLSFFRATRPSQVATAAGGMEDLCEIVTTDATGLAAGAAGACATTLAVAMLAPKVAMAVGSVVLLAIAVRVVLRAAEIVAAEPLQEAEQRNSFFLRSLVWDLPYLRLINADTALCANYIATLRETGERSLRVRQWEAWRAAVAAATPACALLTLACSGPMGRAVFAAALVGAAQLTAAGTLIEEKCGAAIRLRQIVRRLRPLLTAPTEPEAPAKRTFQLRGAIRVDGLTFRWPEARVTALEDLSLQIAPGEFVALAGPSGSGKSTLIRLLLGFDQPSRGSIEFDGQPATASDANPDSNMDTETLRSQIEVVLQDQSLSDGTIRSNLIGQSSHGMDDAWAAARLACVDEEIAAMPMGMQTFASDSVVSTGQRQRLLLARAIVRRPAILILDESLSGLDEQLQHRILTNLRQIPGMTCIIASHRPSMKALMDRTYRLERGRIAAVEYGSPDPHPDTSRETSVTSAASPSRFQIAGLYRPEAVDRFESAEPLDRVVLLW